MSSKYMGAVWDLRLTPTECLVLLAMADHADHNGENVFPSLGLVAWKTNLSERTVRRIVRSLRKKEILIPGDITDLDTRLYSIDLSRASRKKARIKGKPGRPCKVSLT